MVSVSKIWAWLIDGRVWLRGDVVKIWDGSS